MMHMLCKHGGGQTSTLSVHFYKYMISLTSRVHQDLDKVMQKPGAFCWWYLDLVDEMGDGMVLVWSFGLPFLPGARLRPRPVDRPALSVAVYRGGRADFYLLQQLAGTDVAMSEGWWQFGDSTIALTEHHGARRLVAKLDMPVPATRARLVGEVEAHGQGCRLSRTTCGDSRHGWSPLMTAARGTAEIVWGNTTGDAIALDGRSYLDSNASTVALDELGIDDWLWGRVGLGARELVYYVVRPEHDGEPETSMVLLVEPSGETRLVADAELSFGARRRGLYGLSHDRTLRVRAPDLDVLVEAEALVEDGPFYLRSLIRARSEKSGESGHGVAERVVPKLVDVPWQRPFVRMRRHVVGGDNSIWLPLFSGKKAGRLGRLVAQLFNAEAP